MTFISALYSLTIDVLTFWMPVVYTCKYLMVKDLSKIPRILKFWCMISVYNVISLLLCQLLDDNIFPFVNLVSLVVLNLPPYEIAEKMYNSSLGAIYNQNRQSFESLEQTIIKIFDKNSQTLKNKMKDSTGQKIKGVVGDLLMATLTASTKQASKQKKQKRHNSSDQDSDKD